MTESCLPESAAAAAVAAPEIPVGRINCMWRRIFALVVDSIILGIVGLLLGLCFGTWFSTIGPWGRLIGLAIAVCYFGQLNGTLGNGRTFGKWLLGIRVVTDAGIPPSVLRACLRAIVLFVPYFLNNLQVPARLAINPIYTFVAGTIVFAGMGAIVYLALFNRVTRQSLHDLICGTYVVRAKGTPCIPVMRPWRGHYVIMSVLMLVLLIGGTVAGYYMKKKLPMRELERVTLALDKTGNYWSASAFRGTTWSSSYSSTNSSSVSREVLQVNVLVKRQPRANNIEAARIARIALKAYPAARNIDAISVTITHGYDIGIASFWQSSGETKAPAEWDEGSGE